MKMHCPFILLFILCHTNFTEYHTSGLLKQVKICYNRSSYSQMFFKIGILKNLANFKGKHQSWSLFLIKLQASGLQLYWKETLAQVFSCGICMILKSAFFDGTLSTAASVQLDRRMSQTHSIPVLRKDLDKKTLQKTKFSIVCNTNQAFSKFLIKALDWHAQCWAKTNSYTKHQSQSKHCW